MRLAVLGPLFLSLSDVGLGIEQDWSSADVATTRLKPSEFTEVPMAIRTELERRGCTVPQPHGATRPTNVISGKFTSSTMMDWADRPLPPLDYEGIEDRFMGKGSVVRYWIGGRWLHSLAQTRFLSTRLEGAPWSKPRRSSPRFHFW